MTMNRRGFLGLMLAAAAAPAFVKADSLMKIVAPRQDLILAADYTLWGDGIHDDSAAFQALIDGKPVSYLGQELKRGPDGSIYLPTGTFAVGAAPILRHGTKLYGGEMMALHDGPMLEVPDGTKDVVVANMHFRCARVPAFKFGNHR